MLSGTPPPESAAEAGVLKPTNPSDLPEEVDPFDTDFAADVLPNKGDPFDTRSGLSLNFFYFSFLLAITLCC